MKHFRWIAPLLGLLFFSCTSAEQMMRESVTLYGDTARIVCVGNTEVTGELLCYRYVDMWIVDSANRIRVISYADIKRLEVGGVVIRAYFWPTVAAIALPWTMAAVTSTAYGGDAAHVATRTGFGLLFTAFPLLMNELGSRTPNYTGEELRSYPSARQYFRHQWPLDDTVRQQLLVQHNQSSPLPICDAPGTPLLPRQPSTR